MSDWSPNDLRARDETAVTADPASSTHSRLRWSLLLNLVLLAGYGAAIRANPYSLSSATLTALLFRSIPVLALLLTAALLVVDLRLWDTVRGRGAHPIAGRVSITMVLLWFYLVGFVFAPVTPAPSLTEGVSLAAGLLLFVLIPFWLLLGFVRFVGRRRRAPIISLGSLPTRSPSMLATSVRALALTVVLVETIAFLRFGPTVTVMSAAGLVLPEASACRGYDEWRDDTEERAEAAFPLIKRMNSLEGLLYEESIWRAMEGEARHLATAQRSSNPPGAAVSANELVAELFDVLAEKAAVSRRGEWDARQELNDQIRTGQPRYKAELEKVDGLCG